MKIATVLLKYDYGMKERGESLEKKLFLPAIKSNSTEVVSFWLEENGYPNDIDSLQQSIISFCETNDPDIVFFILMKDEVRPTTIKYLSKKFITVNWFADDQWRFDSFTKYIAPLLTYSISVDKYSIPKYKELGCKVIRSQWASMEYTENINFEDTKYKYDISFVGGKNLTREWYIFELKKRGYSVECFGSGWKNGRISYDEIKDIFLSSKINLNLSNSTPSDIRFYKYVVKTLFRLNKNENIISYLKRVKSCIKLLFGQNLKNVEQIKARNFEIPGFGGFQLSQHCPGLEDYYEVGKEIAVFTNIDDLKLNLDYYLSNQKTREDIKKNGYFKTSSHTYENRLRKIIQEVKSE